jgi:RimJ/RimL family protein N-acetyltransferase
VTPLASDGRLAIRRFVPTDLGPFYAAIDESRAELGPWMAWMHDAYTIADTREWLEKRDAEWDARRDYAMLVVDALDGAPLGAVALNQINHEQRVANLGYWTRTSSVRRGVASSAARLCARFGFAALGFGRIEIVALRENVASCRAAEKAGARFECYARNRLWLREASRDAAMYSLVPGDLA